MRHYLVFLSVFLLMAQRLVQVAAVVEQGSIQFEELPVDYAFGVDVTLGVRIHSDTQVEQVNVAYQPENGVLTTDTAILSPEGVVTYTIQFLDAELLPAFARINYWFEVVLQDGSMVASPTYSFRYDDNRFEWQVSEALPLRFHWYSDQVSFDVFLLEIAQQGIDKINRLIAALPVEEIDIYVYDNQLDMQSTLLLANVDWAAGHADPELGVVVVTLPAGPEQRLLARQRIPHELMHILQFQQLGDDYENLPVWLREGLASMAELENNPDYLVILEKAHEKDLYLPIMALCPSFPRDAANAFLAYAEAEWFTRYLYEQYGAAKMQELIIAYADGVDCERAPELVFDKSLTQLESKWRQEQFGENAVLADLKEVLPWIALLGVALSTPLLLMIFSPAKHRRKS